MQWYLKVLCSTCIDSCFHFLCNGLASNECPQWSDSNWQVSVLSVRSRAALSWGAGKWSLWLNIDPGRRRNLELLLMWRWMTLADSGFFRGRGERSEKGTSCMQEAPVCKKSSGTLQRFVQWKGTVEGTSTRFIYHRVIQEGTFAAFFLTLEHHLPLYPPC